MCLVRGEVLEFDAVFINPLGIRLLGGKLFLDLTVIEKFSGFSIG